MTCTINFRFGCADQTERRGHYPLIRLESQVSWGTKCEWRTIQFALLRWSKPIPISISSFRHRSIIHLTSPSIRGSISLFKSRPLRSAMTIAVFLISLHGPRLMRVHSIPESDVLILTRYRDDCLAVGGLLSGISRTACALTMMVSHCVNRTRRHVYQRRWKRRVASPVAQYS
jgi:hypothetical protein